MAKEKQISDQCVRQKVCRKVDGQFCYSNSHTCNSLCIFAYGNNGLCSRFSTVFSSLRIALIMNHWFWIYIVLVPIVVFSVRPSASARLCTVRLLSAIFLCYILINLSVDLKWQIVSQSIDDNPFATEAEQLFAIRDGANIAFTRMFGWIFAITYTGWYELLWRIIYRSKLTDKGRLKYSNMIISISLFITVWAFAVNPPMMALHILLPPFLDASHLR